MNSQVSPVDSQPSPGVVPFSTSNTLRRTAHHASLLERMATAATNWSGRNAAFACAIGLVIAWAAAGPVFHYSDRWELFINTTTSVTTFVMVFVIQRAQNKDTLALQLKVNELIAAHKHAHNSLIAVERLSEEELRSLHDRFTRLGTLARTTGATAGRLDVDERDDR
jgi:low affinity Fe/Cu permease